MKKLASDFLKILFDKFVWFLASLCILTITFGANLNSRVNALESSKEVDKIEKTVLIKSIEKMDNKLSRALCIWGQTIECQK